MAVNKCDAQMETNIDNFWQSEKLGAKYDELDWLIGTISRRLRETLRPFRIEHRTSPWATSVLYILYLSNRPRHNIDNSPS